MRQDPAAAIREARWQVVGHVLANGPEYRALTGMDRATLAAHLKAFAKGRAAVRGAELTAIARAFRTQVTCFLIAGPEVHER
eukprot:1854041-Rhodomonas_salina.2